MLSDVNGAKSLTSVKLSSLNIAKSRLRTEVFPDGAYPYDAVIAKRNHVE